ncbi:hypothetical protein CR51_22890 [Caballeronia megalochromosomata]|nr:hypothetical protein CR51_22890 [Caballeronia megalochromosomata]
MSTVFPGERDVIVGHAREAVVGDRHAVRVAVEIVKDLLWVTKRFLRVDNLFGVLQGSNVAAKFGRL